MAVKSLIVAQPKRTISVDGLRRLACSILEAHGLSPEKAALVAEPFVEADLRGIYVQGLHHLTHSLVRSLRNGKLRVDGTPKIIREGAAFAVMDGERAPGPLAGVAAVDTLVAKTKEAGTATVGVVNSADMYMIGYYVERAARAGIACLAFVDAPPLMAPPGGAERLIGTNPIALGIPAANADPFVLDISSAAFAYWRMQDYAAYGKQLPEGIAVDRDGNPTRDAEAGAEGSLLPFGGHKGFGLSLAGAFLAGSLLNCDVGTGLSSWREDAPGAVGNQGHLFIGLSPEALGDPDAFRRSVSAYLDQIRNSRKAQGVPEIRIPGEASMQARAFNLKQDSIPIDDQVWERVEKIAAEKGIDLRAFS